MNVVGTIFLSVVGITNSHYTKKVDLYLFSAIFIHPIIYKTILIIIDIIY